jgi:hypothetical protein
MLGIIGRVLRRLGSAHPERDAKRREATAREDGAFLGRGSDKAEAFERDYRAAVALLKRRMDRAHPAAFHRKLSRPGSSSYRYGERRIGIVDEASTAIAMGLRDGDSVAQAADRGAARIGL